MPHTLPLNGKAYECPAMNRAFYNFVCIPFTLGMIGVGLYALFVETTKSFPEMVVIIGGELLFLGLLIGLIFNYYHIGTIIVNEREIVSLKRGGRVSIPWKEITRIYYKIGGAKQDPRDPFFTVYIFSKKNDFIIVNREIDGIRELMSVIRQYADTSRVKHLTFRQLIMLFVRHYSSGQRKLPPRSSQGS